MRIGELYGRCLLPMPSTLMIISVSIGLEYILCGIVDPRTVVDPEYLRMFTTVWLTILLLSVVVTCGYYVSIEMFFTHLLKIENTVGIKVLYQDLVRIFRTLHLCVFYPIYIALLIASTTFLLLGMPVLEVGIPLEALILFPLSYALPFVVFAFLADYLRDKWVKRIKFIFERESKLRERKDYGAPSNEGRWFENRPVDALRTLRKKENLFRVIAVLFILWVLGVIVYKNLTMYVDIWVSVLLFILAIPGFLIFWYTAVLTNRSIPRGVRWMKEGVELARNDGKREFIPWKKIGLVKNEYSIDGHWFLYAGIKMYILAEEVGEELQGAWERWLKREIEGKNNVG